MPRVPASYFPGESLNHLLYPEAPLDAWTLERYEACLVLPPAGSNRLVSLTARQLGIPSIFHQRLIRMRLFPWAPPAGPGGPLCPGPPAPAGGPPAAPAGPAGGPAGRAPVVACLHMDLLPGLLPEPETFRFSSFSVLPRVLYLRSSWFSLPSPEVVVGWFAVTRRPPNFPDGLRVVLELQRHVYVGAREPLVPLEIHARSQPLPQDEEEDPPQA